MSVSVAPNWPPVPESVYTQPTARCPHPERWTATDSESTEVEVQELIGGLVVGLQPEAVLETGTAFGQMAREICGALETNGHGRLFTVEYDPARYAQAVRTLAPWSRWSAYLTRSLAWTPPRGITFDLCYFDAYYRDRVAEFDHFRPWMRPGTICCFHDTAPGHGETVAGNRQTDIMSTIARGLRGRARLIHLPTPRGLSIAEVLP